MARLVIFDDALRVVDLPDRGVTIGRSQKVDIPIRDRLLSRKHCSIVPTDTGFCLVDLRSANGTFVNGVQVERAELAFDDVVEVGSTVLVLLDADTWKRGEGLTRLRNPVKAQELVQRLKARAARKSRGEGSQKKESVASETVQGMDAAPAADSAATGNAAEASEEIVDLVVLLEVALSLLDRSPSLRERVSSCLEKLRAARSGGKGESLPALRRRVRKLLEEESETRRRAT